MFPLLFIGVVGVGLLLGALPFFFFNYFAMAQRPLLWGRLGLEVCLFINYLQLFLASFFRVFFNWFFISLYCFLSLGL